MIGDWLMKSLLSKVGSHVPKPAFGRLESALNYLYAGRFMKDHRFSPIYVLKQRRELIATVANLLSDSEVLYLEFGVWKGESIRQWSEILKNSASRLHGFDSFEGLPEEWDHHGASVLQKGHFSTQGSIPQIAVVPDSGYADLNPFRAARFRPSQRTLNAYLTVWNGKPCTDALPSMYLDVI